MPPSCRNSCARTDKNCSATQSLAHREPDFFYGYNTFMSSSQSPLTAAPARKWRWLMLVFLLLFLICITWWGASVIYHQQTFHPTGKILFECSPHVMESRLCSVNADGSAYTVFELPTYQSYWMLSSYGMLPWSWSPDGKSIAFLRDVDTVRNSTGRGTGFGLSLVRLIDQG
jgi:hypothetical protein